MTKNMVYKGKTSSYKARRAILLTGLVLTLTLFMVSFVSSAEFDNVKGDLIIDETTSKYGKIIIKDWFGLLKLQEIELKTNTELCNGISCEATQEIIMYQKGVLIDDIKFIDLDSSSQTSIMNFKFYIDNQPYKLGTEVSKGTYQVRLEGNLKGITQNIDWIIKSNGFWIDDWAVWNSSLDTNLISYWNFDETSGTNLEDIINGENNGTLLNFNGTFWTTSGLINGGLNFTAGLGNALVNLTWTQALNLTEGFTWSFWLNIPQIHDGFPISGLLEDSPPNAGYRFQTAPGGSYQGAFYNKGSGLHAIAPGSSYVLNTWENFVMTWNGSMMTTYKDGIFIGTSNSSNGLFVRPILWFGAGKGGAGFNTFFNGTMDEFGAWNVSLNQDQVTQLYNGGLGIPYSFRSVILNSPEDNYLSNTNEVFLNCTATTDGVIEISNMTLWTNGTGTWARNQTVDISGVTNTTAFNTTIIEPTLWSCSMKDTDNFETFAGTNWTINVDITFPIVNITNPYEIINYGYIDKPESLNWTVTDENLNSCWYAYNDTTTNTTVTCSDNGTAINLGNYTDRSITLWANDSVLNENSSTITWVYTLWENSKSNIGSATETTTQQFIYNATYNSSTYIGLTTNLVYNNTEYTATNLGSGNSAYYNYSLIIPVVNGVTNHTYFWSFNFNDGATITEVNTSVQNITISEIISLNVTNLACPTGFGEAFNYTFTDARNLSIKNASIDYNFEYGLGSANSKSIYGTFSDTDVFRLCFNQTTGDTYKLGYGEIVYVDTASSQRTFYEFTNQTMTNNTIERTLYMLTTSKSTSFLFDFVNTNLQDYVGYYARLLRWYPELDQYNIVETGKTDDKGETIMRVEVEDADYRVGLYQTDGSLIKLLDPVRFACLSAPCSYTVTISTSDDDYTSFMGVDVSLIFNETNGIWTYTWNDPSSNTDSMTLLVTKETGTKSIIICNSNSTGTTGVMTCDSSSYSGTIKAVGFRTSSPATAIIMKIINTVSTAFRSTTGLFVAMIIFLALMLIGVVSPLVAVILGILALFPAMLFGSINYSIFIGIAVIGGIVIHFAKRTSG